MDMRQLKIQIGDKAYLISSDDSYLDYIKSGFEPEMVALFKVLASGSRVIVDIGANIGCTSILFSQLSDVVYSYEPSPSTFALLKKNILASTITNVVSMNYGLGADSRQSTLSFSPSNRSGGFVSDQITAGAGCVTETIEIRQLDNEVKSLTLPTIDLIKIDVEGFEQQVLSGAKEVLATYRPIVVLELNHWCLNAFQRTSIPDFFDYLRSIFPVLLAVDGSNYLNLHDSNDSYIVMYHHILHMKFPNIVAAFDECKLETFMNAYQHHFSP